MTKRFNYDIFCDNEGVVRVLLLSSYTQSSSNVWKLFYTIDGTEPTETSTCIFVTDKANAIYTLNDINKDIILYTRPVIKFRTGSYNSDTKSVELDDEVFEFTPFENKDYNIRVFDINNVGENITSAYETTNILISEPNNNGIIAQGSIYITFNGTEPSKDNYEYRTYTHTINNSHFITLHDCVAKAVVIYGDYKSSVSEFTIGNGIYNMELPIITLSPLSIDFRFKNNEVGVYSYTTEDNVTINEQETKSNTNRNINAVIVKAKKYRIAYIITTDNGTFKKYYWTTEISDKRGAIKPIISFIASNKPNEIYVKLDPNNKFDTNSYKVKYSINSSEYKDYVSSIKLVSNDILHYYNTDGESYSSIEKLEIGNIDFESPILEYDAGNDILKTNNIPILPKWLNYCTDKAYLYDNNDYQLGVRTLPAKLDDNRWSKIKVIRSIGIRNYTNNSYVDNRYFKKETIITSLDIITYTAPSINYDEDKEEVVVISNGSYKMYITTDGTTPTINSTLINNGDKLKPVFGTIIRVVGYDESRQEYTKVTDYVFKKLYSPTITVDEYIRVNNPNIVGDSQIQINDNGTWININNIKNENFRTAKCRIIYKDEDNIYESKIVYALYIKPYVVPPELKVDEDGNVTIFQSTTNTIRYIINSHFIIPTNLGFKYDGQNIKLKNNDYIETMSVDYNNNYSKIVSYFYSKDYITSTGAIIEKLDSDKIDKVNRKPYSYFDIINNDNYEIPKILTSINYIVNTINSNFDLINKAEESLNRKYSGYRFKVYNEENNTGILDIETHDDKKYNGISLNPKAYKYPYWDKGKWNFNYIRNSIAYDKPSDESAILYGKYFVARFIFDNSVKYKFENINFIINNE